VQRATTELKNFYVLQKIEELKKEMKSGNKDDYVTLITQLKQLQEIRKVLAKELGERIVLKY
jgi:DNA primase